MLAVGKRRELGYMSGPYEQRWEVLVFSVKVGLGMSRERGSFGPWYIPVIENFMSSAVEL